MRSTTSWLVRSPGMTSIIGIRWGGFDQWLPMTRSGCSQASAIAVIGMPEVLDARTASAATCFSNSRKTSCLSSRRSGTASRTMSAPSRAAPRSDSNVTEPPEAAGASSRSRTPSARATAALARSIASALTSYIAVGMPTRASTAPMPGPIVPVPITAARSNSATVRPPSRCSVT